MKGDKKMYPIYLILVTIGVILFTFGYIGDIVEELVSKHKTDRK